MTFNQIVEANKSIKTTNIKGNNYAEVNERIKAFRMLEPEGCISTEIVSLEDGMVVMKASVISGTGQLLGTGTAFEVQSASFINKTSYIENCETSAVGRALAMCGLGIDTSVASMEEVSNAINQQSEPNKEDAVKNAELRTKIMKYIGDNDDPNSVIEYIKTKYKCEPNEMSIEQAEHFIKTLTKNGKDI